MGHAVYCSTTRSARADALGYFTKSADEVFTQQKLRKIHEEMDPKNIAFRECRDSETHPNTVPVIIGLDVTGSMGHVPKMLIKDGLPTMVTKIIQRGVPDLAILFTAIGDAECDRHPLQVGQFESGDAELDLWLTRTYLEGGGGGNPGESYHLVWDFANRCVQTDAWEKRQEKGIIITIGDEPVLPGVNKRLLTEIYGIDKQITENSENKALLDEVQQKWEVFHIHVDHHNDDHRVGKKWRELLGQHVITEKDYTKIPDVIAQIVLDNANIVAVGNEEKPKNKSKAKVKPKTEVEEPEIIL